MSHVGHTYFYHQCIREGKSSLYFLRLPVLRTLTPDLSTWHLKRMLVSHLNGSPPQCHLSWSWYTLSLKKGWYSPNLLKIVKCQLLKFINLRLGSIFWVELRVWRFPYSGIMSWVLYTLGFGDRSDVLCPPSIFWVPSLCWQKAGPAGEKGTGGVWCGPCPMIRPSSTAIWAQNVKSLPRKQPQLTSFPLWIASFIHCHACYACIHSDPWESREWFLNSGLSLILSPLFLEAHILFYMQFIYSSIH